MTGQNSRHPRQSRESKRSLRLYRTLAFFGYFITMVSSMEETQRDDSGTKGSILVSLNPIPALEATKTTLRDLRKKDYELVFKSLITYTPGCILKQMVLTFLMEKGGKYWGSHLYPGMDDTQDAAYFASEGFLRTYEVRHVQEAYNLMTSDGEYSLSFPLLQYWLKILCLTSNVIKPEGIYTRLLNGRRYNDETYRPNDELSVEDLIRARTSYRLVSSHEKRIYHVFDDLGQGKTLMNVEDFVRVAAELDMTEHYSREVISEAFTKEGIPEAGMTFGKFHNLMMNTQAITLVDPRKHSLLAFEPEYSTDGQGDQKEQD